MTRIYLDNCCFNRPFDDQTQDRIRLDQLGVRVMNPLTWLQESTDR